MGQVLISIVFDGLAYGMMLFVIAVGLSLTMGLMGFVNLAHGAFAMVGGYLTVFAMDRLGLPFPLALLAAALAVGAASIPLERGLYARLYAAPELDQVMLTIGLVFMATAAVTMTYGPAPLPVRLPGWLKGQIDLGFRAFPTYRVVLIGVGLGLMALLWLVFERTLLGAKIRAAVDNRRMAQSVGINVDRLFTGTFAFGSALAALGGGLAIEIVGLSPTFATQYLVLFLIVVAVGGMASLSGAFVAALILGFLDNAGKYLWPEGGGFFIYVLTVLLLLARPAGLLARSRPG
jgi:branched-chain amino acid transport system permease protein